MSKVCKVGVDAILRDWEGTIITTIRMNRDLFPDPLLGESSTTLQAIIFCKDLGLMKIVAKGDSLQVVHRIQRDEDMGSGIGMFIGDTRAILDFFD